MYSTEAMRIRIIFHDRNYTAMVKFEATVFDVVHFDIENHITSRLFKYNLDVQDFLQSEFDDEASALRITL